MLTTSPVSAAFVQARTSPLHFYSPYYYLRALPAAPQQAQFGTGAALRFGSEEHQEIFTDDSQAQWLVSKLPWDTDYFGVPTYRLFTGLFGAEADAAALATSAARLRTELGQRGPFYAWALVPTEDIQLLQALTGGGWRLVETRQHYHCHTADVLLPPPIAVRAARPDEAAHIGQVSATARNPYDRFHADPWYGSARADAFLARYAEASVEGRCATTVLLPDEPGLPVDSFMAILDGHITPGEADTAFSRVLLTAVGPQNAGWHYKLVAETLRRAQRLHIPYALMTTQATNRAVTRTCEKLGLRLGATSHVLTCHLSLPQ